MTALASLSELVNRLSGGNAGAPEHLTHWQDNRVGSAAAQATVAGRWTSLWLYNSHPASGAVPAAVEAPTRATSGALKQTNPGSGKEKWLLGHEVMATQPGTLIVYDRLLHIGGLNGTLTTAQTVAGSLTRNTGGVGNQIWVEIYTLIGTTATTITASYTNQAGTAGQTTVAASIGAAGLNEPQRIIPLPLASGDNGVRAVASVTLAATTGTAGNFGVTIARPLLSVVVPAGGVGSVRDAISGLPSIQKVDTDACLALAWLAAGTTVPQFMGLLHFVDN